MQLAQLQDTNHSASLPRITRTTILLIKLAGTLKALPQTDYTF